MRKYSAPEVFDAAPRSRLTDIWGLGCVLFEIISAVQGHRLSSMKSFWESHGTKRNSYAENPAATAAWFQMLKTPDELEVEYFDRFEKFMLTFIYFVLMESDRLLRPTAAQVLNKMKDADFRHGCGSKWVGPCCYAQIPYNTELWVYTKC